MISPKLKKEMFNQESADPFLLLVTLEHPTFDAPIRLVANTEDITSRGNEYIGFPLRIVLPEDDGESVRDATLTMDNVSGELIRELRKITTALNVTLETVLASQPDIVEVSYSELKMNSITYDSKIITGRLRLDSFLNVSLPSETYTPTNFVGVF